MVCGLKGEGAIPARRGGAVAVRLLAVVCLGGAALTDRATAQPATIGGAHVESLTIRPSLGLFVEGYVNGRGPYQFLLDLSSRTHVTAAVAREAGLDLVGDGLTANIVGNQVLKSVRVKSATMAVGDEVFDITGASIASDRDLSAYVPIRRFGGWLGSEVLRNKIVRLDFSKSTITFSNADEPPPVGADAKKLDLSSYSQESDPLSGAQSASARISVDGEAADLGVTYRPFGIWFAPGSHVGRDAIAKSPYLLAWKSWTPDGTTTLQTGVAATTAAEGLDLGPQSISRQVEPLPFELLASRPGLKVLPPPIDGVMGLARLGRYDITIDATRGAVWLEPRRTPPRPQSVSSFNPPRTLGLSPWLYKDRGVARMILEGSAAQAAGMRPGDEIVSIDGGDVYDFYDHLDSGRAQPETATVIFRNRSGDHTVVLARTSPAVRNPDPAP